MAAPVPIESPRDLEALIYSYYRDAEMRGSNLLYRMLRIVDDPQTQVNLSRHLADETRHAWLWTKRIQEIGAVPSAIPDGYQVRMGKVGGVPRHPIELFALTLVAEQRAMRRYAEHLERPEVPSPTREVLRTASQDEVWHVAWVEKKLQDLAKQTGDARRIDAALEKFRRVDLEVVAELEETERGWVADLGRV